MAYSRHFALVGQSVNICISETATRISFKLAEIVPRVYTRNIFLYWGSIGPTGDKNGLFTPFAKFLKICSVTFLFVAHSFLRMSYVSHQELDSIESLKGGIPGSDWDPQLAKNTYFHTVCPLSLNLFINSYFLFVFTVSSVCYLSVTNSWSPRNARRGTYTFLYCIFHIL